MPSTTPSPWKSLTRFLLRSLYTVLLATLLWSLWYAYAAHRLNTKLAEYRARGEPSVPEDLVGKHLPPEENGYLLLTKASDVLQLTTDERELVDSPTSMTLTMLPLSHAQMEVGRQMIETHADVLHWIAQASRASGIACPTDPANLAKSADMHHLGKFRELTNFIRAVALFHHQSGCDDLVVDDVQQLQMISQITANGHYLIHGLVAMAMSDVAARLVLHLAPDLEIQSPSHPHGMPREAIVRMRNAFLDSQSLLNTFRLTLEGERLFSVAFGESLDRHTLLLRPMFRLDAIRAAGNVDGILAALGETPHGYNEFSRSLPKSGTSSIETNAWLAAHLVSQNHMDYQRIGLLHYRYISNSLAAALRLAIRLYEVDHAGALPPDLESLQPRYLTTLPGDPFALTSRTFIYAPARHLFYSVGKNGTDDGGIFLPNAILPDWQTPDAVYSLERNPTPSAPTSAP